MTTIRAAMLLGLACFASMLHAGPQEDARKAFDEARAAAIAKKFGLVAAAGLFFAKFGKIILLGLVVFGGVALKFFKGRGAKAASAPPAAP